MGCSSSIDNQVKISKLKLSGEPDVNQNIPEVQKEVKPPPKTVNTDIGMDIGI